MMYRICVKKTMIETKNKNIELKKSRNIVLYTLPNCRYGRKIEKYLMEKRIFFEKKEMNVREVALEIFEKSGISDSPQLVFKDMIMVGYDKKGLDFFISYCQQRA